MSKILIIDDSALSRRMLRTILEGGGHTVVEAGDGLSGLEQFSIERPDLTFLDLTMPGMNGFEVLEKLRQVDPGARVVVASADIQQSSREMTKTGGAKGFINKPYVADDVLQTVDRVLKGDQK
jgi:two-component system, chemotaxis family, chemotaxis protein CheY